MKKCYNIRMEKSYYTYILKCADNTLYCGYTDDVERRLATHNAGEGAKYTKAPARRPVELLSFLKFPDKETAMKCEWWFKHKFSRAEKFELIETGTLQSAFEEYMKDRQK